DVIRIEDRALTLTPQVPEQALFRDALCDPAQRPRFDARCPCARRLTTSQATLALGFGDHLAKAVHHPPEEALWRLRLGRLGFIRNLAIEFVSLCRDRNKKDLHV